MADEEFMDKYWQQFSEEEKQMILHPEHAYLGRTPVDTRLQVSKWHQTKGGVHYLRRAS